MAAKIEKDIRAVIFDLGRVLVKVDLTKGLFRQFTNYKNKNDLEIMEQLFGESLYPSLASGKITGQDFYEALRKEAELDLPYEEFAKEWCSIFGPMPGMRKLVLELSEKFKLGLLSDIGPIHWDYLYKEFPILLAFKNPVLSFKTGLMKPESGAYKMAAESVESDVENCLFIDDREINVQGAEDAGMSGLRFFSTEQLILDLKSLGLYN